MHHTYGNTVCYPEASAYALRVRDALGLPLSSHCLPPPTLSPQPPPEVAPTALEGQWTAWWDRLLRILEAPEQARSLVELDEPPQELSHFPDLATASEAVAAEARIWALVWAPTQWQPTSRYEVHPFLRALERCGSGTTRGRWRLARRLGTSADDIFRAVVLPVEGAWGTVTRGGILLISELVAHDFTEAVAWLNSRHH